MGTFERLESEVRYYCRSFPTVFKKAIGDTMIDEAGRCYIDFLAGAGALNYGHNHPVLKESLLEYLVGDGLTHSLDMATSAKRDFLEAFEDVILKSRKLKYKVMFPGPTGTNSVEAALKLARKVTGRENVIAFTNAFHGMTLGSLSITGNRGKRAGAGVPLANVTRVPFDGYMGADVDTLDLLESYLDDSGSGVDLPAAVVLETVQAEGGLKTASIRWLKRLQKLARARGFLLIVDDIQVGCGRTGPFFSFETAQLEPDIVCLSKSLSGYGLPLSVTLMKPEWDQWDPAEHNGTFRGSNPAFVTATAALEHFWRSDQLTHKVLKHGKLIRERLCEFTATYDGKVHGRGMIQGIEFPTKSAANDISQEAFERGLLVETSGPDGEVLKVMPPLTIEREALEQGLEILGQSIGIVLEPQLSARAAAN